MTEAAQAPESAETASVQEPRGAVEQEPRGAVEWFWRGAALKRARNLRSELPAAEQLALARALAARELADRAYDPVEPLRSGSSLPLAISLYREAAYWALLAQDQSYAGETLAALFGSVPESLLGFAAGSAEGLLEVRRALVERSFVQTAALAPEQLPREAQVAREFVHALLRRKLLPEDQVGTLLLQRGARLIGAALLLVAVVVGGWLGIERLRLTPDLAAGKRWHASSSLETCKPAEHWCGGRTDIFFTTIEEKEPWFELDLGKPTQFDRVDVVNRSDCCPDRAVPLVVEVSSDQKKWREVSRRVDTFGTWRARFAPQTVRYVRLRALRRTILHLEKVSVRNG